MLILILHVRPAMLLSKLDFDEDRISRMEYPLRLSSLAQMEKGAKTYRGY